MAATLEGYSAFGLLFALLAVSLTGTFFSPLSSERKYFVFRIQLILVVLLIFLFLSRFLWVRLTSLLDQKSRQNAATGMVVRTVLLIFLCLGNSSFIIGRIFVGPEPFFITMLAYTCLGLMILIFCNLLFWSCIVYVVSHLKFPWYHGTDWKKVKILISITVSLLMCVVGLYTALGKPQKKYVTIPIHKLPLSLNATKIIQISDVHLGPTVGKTVLEKIVNIVNHEEPDIVVITGDLVDSSEKSLKFAAAPLAKLQTTYGSYFITGNHEYIAGNVDDWFAELQNLGITPLHNSRVEISHPKHVQNKLYLAGVDDLQANSIGYGDHGMKLPLALDGRRHEYPTVLLAHQPKAAMQAIDQYQDIDLVLSGHTHGGQFFPLHVPIYLLNPFFAGLYRYKSSWVFVSTGTCYWGIPFRIGSTPEISIISLVQI